MSANTHCWARGRPPPHRTCLTSWSGPHIMEPRSISISKRCSIPNRPFRRAGASGRAEFRTSSLDQMLSLHAKNACSRVVLGSGEDRPGDAVPMPQSAVGAIDGSGGLPTRTRRREPPNVSVRSPTLIAPNPRSRPGKTPPLQLNALQACRYALIAAWPSCEWRGSLGSGERRAVEEQ